MAKFRIEPIEAILLPNYYSPIKSGTWQIVDGQAATLNFILNISDALGERRYCAAPGATLVLTFRRADLIALNSGNALTGTSRDVVVNATVNATDASMWSASVSGSNSSGIVSGGVLAVLTEGSTVNSWIQDYLVEKVMLDKGC